MVPIRLSLTETLVQYLLTAVELNHYHTSKRFHDYWVQFIWDVSFVTIHLRPRLFETIFIWDQARNQGLRRKGEAPLEKFLPHLEKCVGHNLKILDIVPKIWAPLRKLFAPPGVPIWLRACLRPHSFETTSFETRFIWDLFIWYHIHMRLFHLRPHSFKTTFIWDHIHMRLSFETTLIRDLIHFTPR